MIFRDSLFYNARLISKYYITNYSKRLFFKFYGKLLNGILKLFRLLLPIYNFTYRYISRYIEIHHPVAILLISSIKQDYENGGQTTLTIKDNHEFVRNFLSLLFIKLNLKKFSFPFVFFLFFLLSIFRWRILRGEVAAIDVYDRVIAVWLIGKLRRTRELEFSKCCVKQRVNMFNCIPVLLCCAFGECVRERCSFKLPRGCRETLGNSYERERDREKSSPIVNQTSNSRNFF